MPASERSSLGRSAIQFERWDTSHPGWLGSGRRRVDFDAVREDERPLTERPVQPPDHAGVHTHLGDVVEHLQRTKHAVGDCLARTSSPRSRSIARISSASSKASSMACEPMTSSR